MKNSPRKMVWVRTREHHCAAWTGGHASLPGCKRLRGFLAGDDGNRAGPLRDPQRFAFNGTVEPLIFQKGNARTHEEQAPEAARPEAMAKQMNRYEDIRWQQRFENFDRAFSLLREALSRGPAALNQLEKEGVVQRFEYTLELAWKTIKDFLESSGFVLIAVTPRQVIRDAFAAKVIADGQAWIDMIDHRNLLSHTYDPANFEEAVEAIHSRYLTALDQLHDFLGKRRNQ